jgi:hypothetical protein
MPNKTEDIFLQLPDELESQKNEILQEFDFEKVHDFMLKNELTWGISPYVPSVNELKKRASELLDGCIKSCNSEDSGPYYTATGRFFAYRMFNKLGLQFYLECWDCFD